ncbi:MAG TPA: M48 family metallopeptidase [Thermoanaerobaculia bacterium]|nr:M48 family metallopeptidase [Thermoanaerobaculia bacterium]
MPRRAVVLAAALAGIAAIAAAAWAADSSPARAPMRPDPPPPPEATAGHAAEGPVSVPEPSTEALSYYRSGNLLWTVAVLWGLAVPAVILFSGLSARLRDWAARHARGRWLLTLLLFVAAYTTITYLVDVPLSLAGFARQHAYGLSNKTLVKWATDSAKALGVSLIAASFLWMPYLLLARSPRRWWLYTGLAAVPFLCFVMLVSPIWIAPLFNDFGPMQDQRLEAKILALADRVGMDADRVYEVAKSVDTKRVNAYVTGFAGTHRIVLWDTLLARLDDDEVLFVMAHELGHYVLGHVTRGVLLSGAVVLLGLWLIHRTSGGMLRRWGARFGFTRLADPASLPLLALLLNLYGLLLSPFALAYSRHQEHQADVFALELTQASRPAATAFVALQTENLSNPRPGWVFRLLRASHPPLGERIDFANAYRPWERGEPLRYGEWVRAAAP